MIRYLLLLLVVGLLSSCGVYLEYPLQGNSQQWKLITSNDSLVFRLHNTKYSIDSVINNASQQMLTACDSDVFKLPAKSLKPGLNDLSLSFYLSNGRKKVVNERLYMVSDVVPEKIKLDNYYLLKHDQQAFTQGLLWYNGFLYETTGLVGHASVRVINPNTGELIKKKALDKEIFAEGIAMHNQQFAMLTWKDGLVYLFDDQLKQQAIVPFHQEGWGLTHDGKQYIASNGTNQLFFLSDQFKTDSTLQVYNNRGPVTYLNELEFINGYVWANVLGSDKLVVIDLESGKVEYEIDLSDCLDRNRYKDAGVLNGIAYDSINNTIFLTGKNWPYILVWSALFFEKSNN